MGAVFLSYRRGDSEGQARALSLELERLLGHDSVFMDVDSIGLGYDFRQVLQERLASCSMMMVLIGPGWLAAADASGTRRLDVPTDFVRQEVAAALKRNIPVVPVLLQGARMPSPEQLPEEIADLSYRNGFELGHSTWESDVSEMVRRLGLLKKRADAPASPVPREAIDPGPSPRPAWLVPAVTGLAVVALGVALFLLRGSPPETAATNTSADAATPGASDVLVENTSSTAPGASSAPLAAGPSVTTAPLSAPSAFGKLAGGGIEFTWPGDDCWDIVRGTEAVTYRCGANTQALGPGTYTIKGRHAAVFLPFDVVVKAGAPTQIAKGGVLEFQWPGDDCWDVVRGGDQIVYQCGTKKQALAAGTYMIKGRHAPIFTPFQIRIEDGTVTRVRKGGVFTFNWAGNDCWDVLRGPDPVTYQCGTNKQALGAGTYTIKGRHAAIFAPFDVTVTDGGEVKAP